MHLKWSFNMSVKFKYLLISVVTGLTLFTITAYGSNEKNPYIVHRQAIFEIADGHMKALQSILLLGHPAKKDINYHATGILEAFEHHGDAFPSGSDKGKTLAKMKIWFDPEGFETRDSMARKAMRELIKASEGSDQELIKEKFSKVGKSCKGCHDDYRKKDD